MSQHQRTQLRRSERRRRRGGAGRAPRPVQRLARRVAGAGEVSPHTVAQAGRGDRPMLMVLVAVMVLGVVMLSGPAQRYLDGQHRVGRLETSVAALEEETDELEQRRDRLTDPDEVELLAREEQGFVRPGEVPYTLVPPEVERPRIATPRDVGRPDPEPWYARLWDAVAGG